MKKCKISLLVLCMDTLIYVLSADFAVLRTIIEFKAREDYSIYGNF
jgi:hypothetical protein